ncbi:MAG: TetR/AcrR family transcriptional regulator [Segniliparus sp.]|uniref:TetR/AcrR family transcriptional regulator n=1 Tax=Segniliparus sp. TaxID=2804064 RepID=UPI003F2F2351
MTTDAGATSASRGPKPVGKEEVVEAVLSAAASLFAEKGPRATSVREVAALAGVNHGLVHRHFGSKDRLLGATLQHLADTATAARESGAGPEGARAVGELHMRLMLRAILDGYPVAELQERKPGLQSFLGQVLPEFEDERQARLAAGHAVALQLGWRLLGPFLRAGLGLDDLADEELWEAVNAEVRRITTAG